MVNLNNRRREDEAFRNYLTDILAGAYGVKTRYHDIIHPAPEIDPEAVLQGVASKIGLEVI